MEPQEPQNPEGEDDPPLAERVAQLESRIAHLENEMKSIAKMENALTGFLGRSKKTEES